MYKISYAAGDAATCRTAHFVLADAQHRSEKFDEVSRDIR